MTADILEFVHGNWPQILVWVATVGTAWLLGRWRARSSWRKREFLDQLNVSLNSLDGGVLRIRTIAELDCAGLFRNRTAAAAIADAARRTTEAAPLLDLPKDDYWYYVNFVLNDLSTRFAAGYIRRDLGGDVRCGEYLLCLTCEPAGTTRTRKVRAMLIRKETLEAVTPESPDPAFESDRHATRWKTIHQMAAEYRDHPWKFRRTYLCA